MTAALLIYAAVAFYAVGLPLLALWMRGKERTPDDHEATLPEVCERTLSA